MAPRALMSATETETHGTRARTQTLPEYTHFHTHTHTAQIHGKTGHMSHTPTHKHIQTDTDESLGLHRAHTHMRRCTQNTQNPHTLSTYTHIRGHSSRRLTNTLPYVDGHGCITHIKTFRTKDTHMQTHLAHIHSHTHSHTHRHPECSLAFCLRVPSLPLSPPSWIWCPDWSPMRGRHG